MDKPNFLKRLLDSVSRQGKARPGIEELAAGAAESCGKAPARQIPLLLETLERPRWFEEPGAGAALAVRQRHQHVHPRP